MGHKISDKKNPHFVPYVAGVSEKLRRVYSKKNIPVYFKPMNKTAFGQNPKDQIPKYPKSNTVYADNYSEECKDLYTV